MLVDAQKIAEMACSVNMILMQHLEALDRNHMPN